MRRERAENLLDAYEIVVKAGKSVTIAGLRTAVREIILDAMCETELECMPACSAVTASECAVRCHGD